MSGIYWDNDDNSGNRMHPLKNTFSLEKSSLIIFPNFTLVLWALMSTLVMQWLFNSYSEAAGSEVFYSALKVKLSVFL